MFQTLELGTGLNQAIPSRGGGQLAAFTATLFRGWLQVMAFACSVRGAACSATSARCAQKLWCH